MSETKHITLPIRIGYRGADIGCENAKIGGFAKLLDVRGWGYLSGRGHGALGLSQDEAAAEQDAFANLVVEAVNSFASLQEENEALKAALERILCMHDGNPPLSLADIPEIDYARRTISNIHREARAALQGGKGNG